MNVYKYYSPAPYNFEALMEGYFFFCKVSKLNDPYDSSFDLIQSPNFRNYLSQRLPPNAKEIMDNYGTCSFCEDKDNKVMWALYANNYSGFVVEFDASKFEALTIDLLARISYQKVVYKDECPNLDNPNYSFVYRNYEGEIQKIKLRDCLKEHKEMDKLFTHICSYKDSVWEKEKEWRLIAGNDICQNKNKKVRYETSGYKIPMPKNVITSIIIGHNFPKDRLCCIKAAADKYKVTIKKTKPSLPFQLKFEDMHIIDSIYDR